MCYWVIKRLLTMTPIDLVTIRTNTPVTRPPQTFTIGDFSTFANIAPILQPLILIFSVYYFTA